MVLKGVENGAKPTVKGKVITFLLWKIKHTLNFMTEKVIY